MSPVDRLWTGACTGQEQATARPSRQRPMFLPAPSDIAPLAAEAEAKLTCFSLDIRWTRRRALAALQRLRDCNTVHFDRLIEQAKVT
jgi:hypothetical protein